jgi:hypothetical protein
MKTDASFFADLNTSRAIVAQRVQELCDMGLYAEMTPHTDRPDSSVRMQYGDDGDFMVCGRVEHKRRKLRFQGKDSYPYDTIFIDEQYKVDNKSDVPLAYIIENADGTCAAVIYGWTRPLWQIERRWDPHAERHANFYVIHKDHVRFCKPQHAFYVPTTDPNANEPQAGFAKQRTFLS